MIELIAGVTVASAVIRWTATLRTAGFHAFARSMPSLRLRLLQYGSTGWRDWIASAALILLLLAIETALQLAFGDSVGLLTLACSVVAMIVATLALWACPPTVLFLGSSEPGTYRYFR